MLTEAFKTVLWLTLMGSVEILIFVLLKPVTERLFGYKWQYYVWLCAIMTMLAFVCPAIIYDTWAVPENIGRFDGVRIIAEQTERLAMVETKLAGRSLTLIQLLAFLWLIGMVLYAFMLIQRYIRFKKVLLNNSVRQEALDEDLMRVRKCDVLNTPVLIGVFKPVLFIPAEITDEKVLKSIILHERVHCRRHDLLYKWFAALVRCVHWFNPFSYVLTRQIERYCEISCDVEVVKTMQAEEKKNYMRSILYVFEKAAKTPHFALGMASKSTVIKKRFKAIQKGTKCGKIFILVGILLVFFVQSITVFSVNTIKSIKTAADGGSTLLPKAVLSEKEDVQTVEEKEQKEPVLLPYIKGESEKNRAQLLPYTENAEDEEKPALLESQKHEVSDEAVAFEKNSKPFENIEAQLKENGKEYIKSEFNYNGGDTRRIEGVLPDANGCISVAISSNAQETVDIYVIDAETGRDVFSFVIPVPYEASYVIDGLDSQKTYNIVLKGIMRNDWNIESEYIIY